MCAPIGPVGSCEKWLRLWCTAISSRLVSWHFCKANARFQPSVTRPITVTNISTKESYIPGLRDAHLSSEIDTCTPIGPIGSCEKRPRF